METYTKLQTDLNQRIKKARINFKKSSKERLSSADYIKTRLEALGDLWSQFTLTHTQLIQTSDTKELNASDYVMGNIYDITEESFIDYKYELKEALSKLNPVSVAGSSVGLGESSDTKGTGSTFKLPKICIPSFSGKYSEWISFRDLFMSLVHNNKSLDDVQKLHYLKGLLVGEAEQLLRHIPITYDNYKSCWEQLERRYNNKKYLSNCILKRFMAQRNLNTESASALKDLLDTTNECLHALKNLGIDISSWDVLIIYIVSQKLDNESRKQWELKVSEFSEELPTLKQFQDFLETRFRALEFIDPKLSGSNVTYKNVNVPHNTPKAYHTTTFACPYCSDDHRLPNCKNFSKDATDTRREFVQSQGLCFNCLNSGHSVFACRQTSRCRICGRKHHSLLHPKNVTNTTDSVSHENQSDGQDVAAHAATSSSADESTSVTTCFSATHSQVLLATALVNAESKSGYSITLRCLIDPGSQASFITESAVQLLRLKKLPHKSSISGLGGDRGSSLASKSMVSLKLQSTHDPSFIFEVQAFVLNKLTSVLPERQLLVELSSEFLNINLADPLFNEPNKIDILLGADIYCQILLDGIIKGPPGTPIAQQTLLGWILSGPIMELSEQTQKNLVSMHITCINDNDLLRKFWELEADTTSTDRKSHFTDEENKCEEIFADTTRRDASGRYIVQLPFRSEDPMCKYGNSRDIATKRFLQLEKRLQRDQKMKSDYAKVISEYIQLGHMEEVPLAERNSATAVYLPHHAVVKEEKITTKVRVVFDASCQGSNGASLNQDLLVGPILQPDLRHLIMRWRYYPICLVSDIIKMYRQVKVDAKHTDFQRLIWRGNSDSELQHLKLLRVTFGTASAPYLAVRCLQQLAHDEGTRYPLAAERVLNKFYVDDLLTGCESVEEGKQIYNEMVGLLQLGGFDLQKWSSNNEELLKEIKDENKATEGSLHLKIDAVIKILGLTWNRSHDQFEYAVQLTSLETPVTKRKVVRDIARLFDPLGWLAPAVITAKIFIQRLWLSGIGWDEELPPHLMKDWLTYREGLHRLASFNLPQWINTHKDDQLHELHGFCDASSDAYAAVVYLRVVDSQGVVNVSLIASKTKVSPIKQISIPRLELCGAVLLTRLLVEVAEVMNLDKKNAHAWTDSSVVLAWLNTDKPVKWKTFVANRVSEIITSLEPHQWSHVSSTSNPADCASRGAVDVDNQLLWKSYLAERKKH